MEILLSIVIDNMLSRRYYTYVRIACRLILTFTYNTQCLSKIYYRYILTLFIFIDTSHNSFRFVLFNMALLFPVIGCYTIAIFTIAINRFLFIDNTNSAQIFELLLILIIKFFFYMYFNKSIT